jgi:predicted CXXCH cytochrome family protein
MRRSEIVALVVIALALVGADRAFAQPPKDAPKYVGTPKCLECHAKYAEDWKSSHHGWAWNEPDATHVLGDFSGTSFESAGLSAKFSKNGSQFIIETFDQNGKSRKFPVHSTAGVTPLQQYLLEVEKGRLQAFDLAWDTVKNRWYHLYPDQKLSAGDGMHWTGPYKNWNARCAECHATGYEKNYDPRTRTYTSTQAEIGVGCEACHGPGEAHVAWAQSPSSSSASQPEGLTDKGFTIDFSAASPETEIQLCATCHARREPLSDSSPVPGTSFHDSYQLALLRPGLYHPDGSILEEVYVYGSFLQSRMYAKGVRCTDCHDPHSARLKADGNAVCTQCHSKAGNDRFPTLRKADYDTPDHHFHKPDTAGAQCRSCHMIERVYMGVDPRRDHSFRIPRPDLSAETGAPNACTDCHQDRDAAWAARQISARHPVSARRPSREFSTVFAKARTDPAAQSDALFEIAEDTDVADIVRATALDYLRALTTADVADRAAPLLGDTSPLVRTAALKLQRGGRPTDYVPRVLPLLEDRYRSVRVAAALLLSIAPIARLPQRGAKAHRKANAEWRASLLARTDFPETHLVLGGVALTMRNLAAAQHAFREAVRQDPQLVDAWRMLVRIALARRDIMEAARTVDQAVAANPENEMLKAMAREISQAGRR